MSHNSDYTPFFNKVNPKTKLNKTNSTLTKVSICTTIGTYIRKGITNGKN